MVLEYLRTSPVSTLHNGIGIDLFEFGISTVQCTTWEDPNDIHVDT